MARTYIGEKLIRRTLFVEIEDWNLFQEYAKENNKTTAQFFRDFMKDIIKEKLENKFIETVLTFEKDNFEKLSSFAKSKNKTVNDCIIDFTSRLIKYEEDKIKAKPVPE